MMERPSPCLRPFGGETLIGLSTVYDSHGEAVRRIPEQWRMFLSRVGALDSRAAFYGASPCTSDGKLHYMTGVAEHCGFVTGGELLELVAGEYAVVHVENATDLLKTWL